MSKRETERANDLDTVFVCGLVSGAVLGPLVAELFAFAPKVGRRARVIHKPTKRGKHNGR